jgi:hypothetical protein
MPPLTSALIDESSDSDQQLSRADEYCYVIHIDSPPLLVFS